MYIFSESQLCQGISLLLDDQDFMQQWGILKFGPLCPRVVPW